MILDSCFPPSHSVRLRRKGLIMRIARFWNPLDREVRLKRTQRRMMGLPRLKQWGRRQAHLHLKQKKERVRLREKRPKDPNHLVTEVTNRSQRSLRSLINCFTEENKDPIQVE